MKIRPLQGQVLLELLGTPNRSAGGIHFPDKYSTKDQIGRPEMAMGRVVKLGSWPQLPDGRLVAYEMKRGDLVAIDPTLGKIVQDNGRHYRLIDHRQIAALLTPDECPSGSPAGTGSKP